MKQYTVLCHTSSDTCKYVKSFNTKKEALNELSRLIDKEFDECTLYSIRLANK